MPKRKSHSVEENLFYSAHQDSIFKSSPLSLRMRPQNLEEYVGQQHILGEGKLLKRAIDSDRVSSLILYGPPGVGKTTLAHCISKRTKALFEQINAVMSNVEELRKLLSAARHRRQTTAKRTVIFIDEIHRFNKAQQDVLMPDIENGNIILIGATVLNPHFSLISPLLSRSLVFELNTLTVDDISTLIKRAINDNENGLGKMGISINDDALAFLSQASDGDARRALNALEIGALTLGEDKDDIAVFTLDVAQESIQRKQVNYDRDGDDHYNTVSAFIKSMRGSDPDAAVYWLAKMLYAGEDPRFIARRICICAAEDVGNADPQALILANAALNISEFVGLPEAEIPLAQAVIYISCAPKSNASYIAVKEAGKDVKKRRIQDVPVHLKDAHYRGAKKLGHGEGYKYAHNYEHHFVDQAYMPEPKSYYRPTLQGYEKRMKEYLDLLRGQPQSGVSD